MNNTSDNDKVVSRAIEFYVDQLLDEIEFGKELWDSTKLMTYEEYWGYMYARWAILQEMFQTNYNFSR